MFPVDPVGWGWWRAGLCSVLRLSLFTLTVPGLCTTFHFRGAEISQPLLCGCSVSSPSCPLRIILFQHAVVFCWHFAVPLFTWTSFISSESLDLDFSFCQRKLNLLGGWGERRKSNESSVIPLEGIWNAEILVSWGERNCDTLSQRLCFLFV